MGDDVTGSGVGLPQGTKVSLPPAQSSPATPYPVVLEIVCDHRGAEGPGRVNTAASVVYLWEGRVRGNRRGDGEKETEGGGGRG